MSLAKEELYHLIDALPENEVVVAKRFLEFLLEAVERIIADTTMSLDVFPSTFVCRTDLMSARHVSKYKCTRDVPPNRNIRASLGFREGHRNSIVSPQTDVSSGVR
ncbi:MAG: hypothetical protein ACYCYO_21600 [Bacilli bacterium]